MLRRELRTDVSLIPIQQSELRSFIALAFEDDTDLLTTYHISPGTLDHCVDHTMEQIKRDLGMYGPDVRRYKIAISTPAGPHAIGYTLVVFSERAPHELWTFGIHKDYRHKDVLISWLQKVEELLGLPYFTALHNCNTRAIEFFLKNGFAATDKQFFKLLIKCP